MKVRKESKLEFELCNEVQRNFIQNAQIFNVYEIIYTYKTMRGNEKTNRKFVMCKEQSEVWDIFCDHMDEYNSQNPKKAERFIELEFIGSRGVYKTNAFELGVIDTKKIELEGLGAIDLFNIGYKEDFYTDFNRKFIRSKIDLKLYEIIYSYETKRKNKKESKKYTIANSYLEALGAFLEYVENFNEVKDYRAISNVQILDIVMKKAVTN